MTLTATIPSSFQTDRQDLNDALTAIIDAFIAAYPSVVRKYWSEVPQSLTGEGPFVYQGDITETTGHDSGHRLTVFSGYLGYVDVLANPQETNNRVNAYADYMRDLFTANARITAQAGSDGLLVQTGFAEGEMAQGQIRMTDARLVFQYQIDRGRTLT